MIIAVAGQKGGIGKTTAVIALGGLLAEKCRCLVVDLDPQGNLTTGLGVQVADGQVTSYEVITERSKLSAGIVKTGSKVELLPADISLAGGETELLSKVGSFGLLKEQLEEVAGEYDHILLDCPPSLGLLTINALVSADSVLIPVQCQFFALKGLAALLETIQSVRRRLNSSLKILGILPTMAEMNTVLCKDVLAALKERLVGERLFLPVPKSVKFSESTMAGLPIHLYAQEEKLLAGYQEIVGVILSQGGKP